MPGTQDRYLSPDDVAKKLNISPLTVRRWLKNGKLKGLKVGSLWRVRERDLEAFLDRGEK